MSGLLLYLEGGSYNKMIDVVPFISVRTHRATYSFWFDENIIACKHDTT